jgi:hypothetical protein
MNENIKRTYADATYEEVVNLATFDGNRVIDRLHVSKLMENMENYLDVFPPITVNTVTKHIIDGQHRRAAFVQLIREGRLPKDSTMEVKYVTISPEEEIEATIAANINSKSWTLNTYMDCFATHNNEYAELRDWCKNHPLMFENKLSKGSKTTKGGYRYRFAGAILKGYGCQKELTSGKFTVTDEEYSIGEVVYSELERIFKLIDSVGKPSALEYVAIQWRKVRKAHPIEDWYAMFKKKRLTIQRMPKDSGKDWETVFNKISTEISKNQINKI